MSSVDPLETQEAGTSASPKLGNDDESGSQAALARMDAAKAAAEELIVDGYTDDVIDTRSGFAPVPTKAATTTSTCTKATSASDETTATTSSTAELRERDAVAEAVAKSLSDRHEVDDLAKKGIYKSVTKESQRGLQREMTRDAVSQSLRGRLPVSELHDAGVYQSVHEDATKTLERRMTGDALAKSLRKREDVEMLSGKGIYQTTHEHSQHKLERGMAADKVSQSLRMRQSVDELKGGAGVFQMATAKKKRPHTASYEEFRQSLHGSATDRSLQQRADGSSDEERETLLGLMAAGSSGMGTKAAEELGAAETGSEAAMGAERLRHDKEAAHLKQQLEDTRLQCFDLRAEMVQMKANYEEKLDDKKKVLEIRLKAERKRAEAERVEWERETRQRLEEEFEARQSYGRPVGGGLERVSLSATGKVEPYQLSEELGAPLLVTDARDRLDWNCICCGCKLF